MRKIFFIMHLLLAFECSAQKQHWTRFVINPQLKIDTSFNINWSYPWYVVKDEEDGSFENTIGDTIEAHDTAHLYYTAACTNTHMGSHQINYCKAYLYNNDVELHFAGKSPGYNEEMQLVIRKNYFSGEYHFQPLVLEKDKEISFEILSQRMVLKKKPVYDSMITGTIEIRFREKIKHLKSSSSKKVILQPTITYSKIYVLKGTFHTPLNDVMEIE